VAIRDEFAPLSGLRNVFAKLNIASRHQLPIVLHVASFGSP
jgi:hypothetical protein